MSDPIVSVYSDARTEYTKQLCVFLVPSYFQFFLGLLEKAKVQAQQEPKRLLWHFQNLLNDIPEWNMEKVHTEISHIQTTCGCDYLEDLLTAVFIAYTKVLTAIRISSSKQNKVQITVPKVEQFLFRVLCETSKLLWGSTYLFRDDVNSIEKQQNYRSIEALLQEGIAQAVRGLVPVKSILKDFVSNEDSDDEEEKSSSSMTTSTQSSVPPTVTTTESLPDIQMDTLEIPKANEIDTTTGKTEENTVVQPIESEKPVEIQPQEEHIQETSNPPIIRIDDKPEVAFAKFDAVFDSDNPEASDMIHGGFDSSGLEVVDEDSIPLAANDDSMNEENDEDKGTALDDYEVLV